MGKTKLKGKFVVGYDTLCDGNQCWRHGNHKPVLYDTYEQAFFDLFDDAIDGLLNKSVAELHEIGVYKRDIKTMIKLKKDGDVKAMEDFLSKNPQCNDYGNFVEAADKYMDGKKIIFSREGDIVVAHFIGEKL